MRREIMGAQVPPTTWNSEEVIMEPPARGILREDLQAAVDEELCTLARVLTPRNVRGYLHLPQDREVVAVEPVIPSRST